MVGDREGLAARDVVGAVGTVGHGVGMDAQRWIGILSRCLDQRCLGLQWFMLDELGPYMLCSQCNREEEFSPPRRPTERQR